jgi:hypothetical protein
MTDDEHEDPLDNAARHEAGHAVMRWLLSLPGTTSGGTVSRTRQAHQEGVSTSSRDQRRVKWKRVIEEKNGSEE